VRQSIFRRGRVATSQGALWPPSPILWRPWFEPDIERGVAATFLRVRRQEFFHLANTGPLGCQRNSIPAAPSGLRTAPSYCLGGRPLAKPNARATAILVYELDASAL
jgi:hypothetical protein